MSQTQSVNQSNGRKIMAVASWAIGVIFLLLGVLAAIADPQPGSIVLGLGLLLGGLAILPPFVRRARERLPFMKPFWVPPLLSFIVLFATMLVSAPLLAAADAASPEGQARIEAQKVADAEKRVTEIAEIEALIAVGTVESTRQALSKLGAGRFKDDVAEGGELRDLLERANTAAEVAKVRGEANGYMARLNEALPKVEAIFTGRPETELAIAANLETMDATARLLGDGEKFADDAEVRPLMNKLRQTLSQKQIAAFPHMRSGYGTIKDAAVWENDMDITVQGGGNRTIRFIAGIFAANRNIAEFERTVRPMLSQLRYKRTQYEWYRGSEYTYYTLETPGDGEIGYWNGSSFTSVPSPQ